jgi:hypothetical protein
VNIPAVGPDTVSTELPEPAPTLFWLKITVRLGSEALAERETVEKNPNIGVIVIVDLLEPPVSKVMLVGFAAIAKSWTVRLTTTE